LATLLKENSCFTLHRFDQSSDDQREVSIDNQQPATATGIDDEASSSQDRLFKRSAVSQGPSSDHHHQLTAAEWQLLLQEIISQHNVDTSDEKIHHSDALLADEATTGEMLNNHQQSQHLDSSSEEEGLMDDDQSWDQVKDAELLKKLFGVSWESVKDMKFDHTSTEDLIEDWLRKQHLSS
jgi:hypothetical protein